MKRIFTLALAALISSVTALYASDISEAAAQSPDKSGKERSYSVCTVKVLPGFDALNYIQFKFDGYGLGNCSKATVCLRRVTKGGHVKTYDEIIYSCSNPTPSRFYKTGKKLSSDEGSVKLRYLELTDKGSGEVTRYLCY